MIKFTIYGVSVPKQSYRSLRKPIITKTGKVIYGYQKAEIVKWEQDIAIQSLKWRQEPLLDCPLCLSLSFFIKRPKSVPMAQIWKITAPDLLQYIKPIEDALQGIIYVNDSRICKYGNMEKRYTVNEPRIEVEIEAL